MVIICPLLSYGYQSYGYQNFCDSTKGQCDFGKSSTNSCSECSTIIQDTSITGTYTNAINVETKCPHGTFDSGGQCTVCPAHQYQDETGQTSCKDCPTGESGGIACATDVNKGRFCDLGNEWSSTTSQTGTCLDHDQYDDDKYECLKNVNMWQSASCTSCPTCTTKEQCLGNHVSTWTPGYCTGSTMGKTQCLDETDLWNEGTCQTKFCPPMGGDDGYYVTNNADCGYCTDFQKDDLKHFNGQSLPYGKPAFVDIDDDGDMDAFVGTLNGKISYFKNIGTDIYEQQTGNDNPLNHIDVGQNAAPTFVDIDGDGDMDVFVGSRRNGIYFIRNCKVCTLAKNCWPPGVPGVQNPYCTTTGTTLFAEPLPIFFNFTGTDLGKYTVPVFLEGKNNAAGERKKVMIVGNKDGKKIPYFTLNTWSRPSVEIWQKNKGYTTDGVPIFDHSHNIYSKGYHKVSSGKYVYEDIGKFLAPAVRTVTKTLYRDGLVYKRYIQDVIVGNEKGKLIYFKNKGPAGWWPATLIHEQHNPVYGNDIYQQQTGNDNPYVDTKVSAHAAPTTYRLNVVTHVGTSTGVYTLSGVNVVRNQKCASQYEQIKDENLCAIYADSVGKTFDTISNPNEPEICFYKDDKVYYNSVGEGLTVDDELKGYLPVCRQTNSGAVRATRATCQYTWYNNTSFFNPEVSDKYTESDTGYSDCMDTPVKILIPGNCQIFTNFYTKKQSCKDSTSKWQRSTCGNGERGLTETACDNAEVDWLPARCQGVPGANFSDCTPWTTTNDECQTCPVGKFRDSYADENCKDCPSGWITVDDTPRIQCVECKLGVIEGVETCLSNCATGEYPYVYQGGEACGYCPTGQFSGPTGQFSDVVQQAAAYPTNSNGNVELTNIGCKQCPIGRYNDQYQQAACKSCPTGKYQDVTGATECKSCPTGKYQDVTGGTECKSCSVEKYQDVTGGTECKSCPGAKTSSTEGSTSSSDCKNCQVGRYEGQNSQCIKCRDGKTTTGAGKTSDTDCSVQCDDLEWADGTECKECSDDQFFGWGCSDPTKLNAAACVSSCDVTGLNQTVCTSSNNQWTDRTWTDRKWGTVSENPIWNATQDPSRCLYCPVGREMDIGCEICDQKNCTSCPAGKSTLGAGNVCQNCPVGKYQDIAGQGTCKSCPKDTYQNVVGSAQTCTACSLGFFSDEGSSVCKSCSDRAEDNIDNLDQETYVPNCFYYNNDNGQDISIPDSIETIGSYAFARESFNVHELNVAVILNSGVLTIKEGAFQHRRIKNIALPASVEQVESNAFDTKSLKSVFIEDGDGLTLSNDVFGNNVETLIFGANPLTTFQVDRFKNLKISSIVPSGIDDCTASITTDCKCQDVYCRGVCEDNVCVLNGLPKCVDSSTLRCWCSWSVCKADETCVNNNHCVKTDDILEKLELTSTAKDRYCSNRVSDTGDCTVTSSTGFVYTFDCDSVPFSNETLLEYHHYNTWSNQPITCP